MIDYLYSQGILRVAFKEKINFEDILDYLKDFSDLEELPSDLKILYNFEEADFNLTNSEINMIAHVAEKSTKKYNCITTAFIVNNPKLTAYAMLFSELRENKKAKHKVFSTQEAALKWLKQP